MPQRNKQQNKKSFSKKDAQLKKLENGLINNGLAINNPRRKKSWTHHDFKSITPLNEPQRAMFESFIQGQHVVANGSAGTGKTFAALFLAVNDVLSPHTETKRIIIVRSAVASRNVGHLPGSLEEKMEVYETPYKDMMTDLSKTHNPNTYENMKEAGIIQFMTTSYVRGVTWDDAIIIVDEMQNMNFMELNSVVTRVGDESKLIMVGDQIQTDLYRSGNDTSGMDRFLRIADRMDVFDQIMFTKDDIVRSAFVKAWICALEEVG